MKTIRKAIPHKTVVKTSKKSLPMTSPVGVHTTQQLSSTMQIPVEAVFEWLSGASAALLDVTCPGRDAAKVLLSNQPVLIGRDKKCAVCIPVANVSRQHARVSLAGEEYKLEDLDSTNGTFVNGVRISRCVLRNNDQIRIGESHITFVQQRIRDK